MVGFGHYQILKIVKDQKIFDRKSLRERVKGKLKQDRQGAPLLFPPEIEAIFIYAPVDT